MNSPENPTELDTARRFMFEEHEIRGEIVRLGPSLETILGQHFYPAPVAALLGEMLVSSALLSYTLKFDGSLSLQARSEGVVGLIYAECANRGNLRGYARVNDQAMVEGIDQLLHGGTLAITIAPDEGRHYQGIVPLDSHELSKCIEHYFAQSEQLPTAIVLACDGTRAGGILLQALPGSAHNEASRQQQWEHLCSLLATMTADELLNTGFETLLYRLFHQEKVRLFEPRQLNFGCKCSLERVEQAIQSMGAAEANDIVAEQGAITVQCEFCQAEYKVDPEALNRLFPGAEGNTLH